MYKKSKAAVRAEAKSCLVRMKSTINHTDDPTLARLLHECTELLAEAVQLSEDNDESLKEYRKCEKNGHYYMAFVHKKELIQNRYKKADLKRRFSDLQNEAYVFFSHI